MSKRLSEKQVAAIEFLSLPKRGGLTYEQIAEEVGIARSTLQEWRKDDTFNAAINRRIIQRSQDRMPEVFEAAIDGIIEDRNAAILRTFLQAHGLLTEKVAVESTNKDTDTDAMRAEIEAFRKRNNTDSK